MARQSETGVLTGSSYESRILHTLRAIDAFCENSRIPYAVFGGSAVAAYLGHLPRKIHDIDILALEPDVPRFKRFLRALSYELKKTLKSRRARYLKYSLDNHIYQQVVSIFPGKFTLLDLEDRKLAPIEEFDFRDAVRRSTKREIRSLDANGEQVVAVRVLPIEDLVISKLWPVIEPTTVHDSFYLLSWVIAAGKVDFDWDYFSSRVRSVPKITELCFETFSRLVHLYPRSVWYSGVEEKKFDALLAQIMSVLREAVRSMDKSRARGLRVFPKNL